MRMNPRAPDGPRHGHYAEHNWVPSQQGGTYRVVHQEHALPDTGAMNVTFSTFMFPVVDMYGAGMPLWRGVPAACQPARDMADLPQYVLPVPQAQLQGAMGPQGLLPSDLVAQFTGKSV